MKRIFTLLWSLTVVAVLTAQTDVSNTTPQDPKAKAVLDKLSAKTKSYKSMSAGFEYKLENKEAGIDETQKGSILLKGEKYKLNLAGQEVVCNGKTVWTYIEDAEEVQITDNDEEDEEGLSPSKLLTIYEKGFKYKYDKEQTIGGVLVHTIYLYPMKPGEKNYHTIILNVNKAKSQVHSMVVKSKDGNLYTYTLSNFVADRAISDDTFNFKTPDGVEEIDLR